MPMTKRFKEALQSHLEAIISKFGTPFHIYEERGIRENLRRLKHAFESKAVAFKEYYAVKALPRPAIMRIISEERCGFDCSSIPELRLARAAGARPEDIMFTSNNTSHEEFSEALKHGGCILNLDDETFLDHSLVKNSPHELFCCRLNPGSRKTGDEVNSIIGDPLKNKYGIPIERIIDIYRRAKDMGYKRFGLHTMVCSNDRDYRHLVSTARLLYEVAGELWENLCVQLEFINIGGGIGIPYRPNDTELDIESLGDGCAKLGHDFYHTYKLNPSVYMESGRFVTGPHGVLVNRVINRYSKYKEFVGVEVAMPANMRVAIYSTAYHNCTLLNADGSPIKEGERPMVEITVAGSICESCDVLARDIMLPDPQVGDILLTEEDGAHTAAMGFNYNGRTRPQELLFKEDGSVIRIWKAETYDDMVSRSWGLDGPEHKLLL